MWWKRVYFRLWTRHMCDTFLLTRVTQETTRRNTARRYEEARTANTRAHDTRRKFRLRWEFHLHWNTNCETNHLNWVCASCSRTMSRCYSLEYYAVHMLYTYMCSMLRCFCVRASIEHKKRVVERRMELYSLFTLHPVVPLDFGHLLPESISRVSCVAR